MDLKIPDGGVVWGKSFDFEVHLCSDHTGSRCRGVTDQKATVSLLNTLIQIQP